MNMSGHYSEQYYPPFGPPNQPFGQPNPPYRHPSFPPNYPPDYNPYYPPNFPRQPQFAEYNLWGSSSYNRLNPADLLHPPNPNLMNHPWPPPFPPPREFYEDLGLQTSPRPQASPRPQVLSRLQRPVDFDHEPTPLVSPEIQQNLPPMSQPRPQRSVDFNHELSPLVSPQIQQNLPPKSQPIPHRPVEFSEGIPLVSPYPQQKLPPKPQQRPMHGDPKLLVSPQTEKKLPPKARLYLSRSLMSNDNNDEEPEPEEGTEYEEPEMTGLEEQEKKVIARSALYRNADDIEYSDYDDDTCPDLEQASNSSGSSGGDWTSSNFQRAGAYPPIYPWASRPSRVVNNRGRKANVMQRRLVRALSQPVKIDKGASMMQRMGWMGGGLGRDESGIVDPIEPNAIYASTTAGFGQEEIERKRAKMPYLKQCTNKKEIFKTNILFYILEFVKDDLVLELYFDSTLTKNERKNIHWLVAALDGRENSEQIDTTSQQEMVNDIHRRNKYSLLTQSDGEAPKRQICVYKSAPNHMFLVTPDDCRPCITEINEVEEEPNPFLKSITKHIRKDEGTILKPKPPHLFDKLVEFFIDFSADEVFTEFRFLGPFTEKEINVVNNFFNLISDLAQGQKPSYKIPVELMDVFATDYFYYSELDPNGYTSIKKVHFNLKEEYEKKREEERTKRRAEKRAYFQRYYVCSPRV